MYILVESYTTLGYTAGVGGSVALRVSRFSNKTPAFVKHQLEKHFSSEYYVSLMAMLPHRLKTDPAFKLISSTKKTPTNNYNRF